MSRTFRFRTGLLLILALGLGAVSVEGLSRASRASAQPHGHADHDQDSDEDEGQGSSAAARADVAEAPLTPEDEARRKQVLANVEGVEITLGKIEDYINHQSPLLRARYKDPAELKKLVDSMVRFELLAAEAKRRSYDKNPMVVRTVKDSAVQNLLRAEVDDKITPQSVPAEDVKAYYEANAPEFHRDALRRASHILVDSEEEAKKLAAQLAQGDARAFTEAAKERSKDLESKLRGGDLGYFSREPPKAVPGAPAPESSVHAEIRKAAFELKNVGDITLKPVSVDGHYSIIRLTGERPERHTDLVEAEPSIRTKLWRERRQKALTDLVEGLRTRLKPQVFADRVDLVKLDDMDKRPSGFSPEPQGAPAADKASPH